jgi:hypothetical protein
LEGRSSATVAEIAIPRKARMSMATKNLRHA